MSISRQHLLTTLFGVGCLLAAPSIAAAADPSSEVARLQSDVARLERELAEQKQLILNMMAADQQRYDVLVQLIRASAGNQAMNIPALPKPATPSTPAATPDQPSQTTREVAATTGKLQGKVELPSGAGEAYVYVDGLRGRTGPLRTVEIRQENKQFAPRVVAVPVGTKLIFPNRDAIFHNVFSKSRSNAFDVGSLKGGTTSSPVALTRPGHVEIMCNIHSKMQADVLVVPNGYFAKVNGDGSFEIDGVPVGVRKVVLWAPGIKPAVKAVEVAGGVNRVQMAASVAPKQPHLNKFGQAYGSYED
ncbi:MAG: hypothetical protein SF187_30055 [Deltaproteobacteria bacterium]|nr:hypothetical protein [Deltaproteobacteria bacterium]